MSDQTYSMPGMVYTPVELGTIRLGHLQEHDGRAIPVKDDQFTITRLVRLRSGWISHPLHEQMLKQVAPPEQGAAERKLREIPIRVMYDSPDLTIRSRYEAFDVQRKRPVCASTSAGQARRRVGDRSEDVACAGPEECGFAQSEGVRCKLFGRITVQIEGQDEADNGFTLRSTSINTLRNFESKLRRYWALFGQRLTGVPFRLVLRAKTTAGSFWRPFYFCDLELTKGVTLQQAASMAREHAEGNAAAGLDIAAWEAVVRSGLDNGALAAGDVEAELMREFFAEAGQGEDGAGTDGSDSASGGEPDRHAATTTTLGIHLDPPPGAAANTQAAPASPRTTTDRARRVASAAGDAGAAPLDPVPAPPVRSTPTPSVTQQPPRRLMPPATRPATLSQFPPRKNSTPPGVAGEPGIQQPPVVPT